MADYLKFVEIRDRQTVWQLPTKGNPHLRDFLELRRLAMGRKDNVNLASYTQREFAEAFHEHIAFTGLGNLVFSDVSIIPKGMTVSYNKIALLPSTQNCSGYFPELAFSFSGDEVAIKASLKRHERGQPCLLEDLENIFRRYNSAALDSTEMPIKGLPEGTRAYLIGDRRETEIDIVGSGMFNEVVGQLVRLYENVGFEKLKKLQELRLRVADVEVGRGKDNARKAYEEALMFATPVNNHR